MDVEDPTIHEAMSDIVGELYIQARPDAESHERAFRCLLEFTPMAFRQTGPLLGDRPSRAGERSTG